MFLSSGEGRETPTLFDPLEERDGNKTSLQNVVFSCYLEFSKTDISKMLFFLAI
jgi:hypothetical protein